MKKLITLALAALLCIAMSVTALAAPLTPTNKRESVTVSTRVDPAYTVTIPANTTIAFNATSTDFGAVTLTAARFETGKGVKVSVTPGDLKNGANDTIPYTIMSGAAQFSEKMLTAVNEKADLTIDIAQTAWDAAKAGDYNATVTFTIAYANIPTVTP